MAIKKTNFNPDALLNPALKSRDDADYAVKLEANEAWGIDSAMSNLETNPDGTVHINTLNKDIYDTATADSKLTDKQDKLVAGNNITIDPNTNTISANGGTAVATTLNTVGFDIITGVNVQEAMGQVDGHLTSGENRDSVLYSLDVLNDQIEAESTVPLASLQTALNIDGRPSNKKAGALVFDDFGTWGFIDRVEADNAVVITISKSGKSGDRLPDQAGNAGKVLGTDGTNASWVEQSGGSKITLVEW